MEMGRRLAGTKARRKKRELTMNGLKVRSNMM
jgi:hypothetical protein